MDTDTPSRVPGDRLRPTSRREQAEATRALLLRTAERLFAEFGLAQVSNRQIVEAAGQANNSALTYHVGTRADLLDAIARAHAEPIARRTREMVEAARGSTRPRDHVASLVLPYTEHLAALGNPSWFARFTAQTSTDPAYSAGPRSELMLGPHHQEGLAAVWEHAPDLPPREAALRGRTMRLAVIHTCAEQERAAADSGTPADWALVGGALTDAVTGLLLAPRHPR
ncbi:TetR family transcriptional regulator [Saccharothrix longispora]|uniref:AcrR family transcriptional regulator n=1 Tax=Saccharothrix longispora TaxID=33920 RepID=A0ABU1PQD7_9PSEU|nr:TetR family transcriptional regulator [Saccharothrix longispora]MBY8848126.1 TetR family transcriptional regulator [Saccharothrix sp. MB29]MDR6592876.1 AcrR family transcriptional regulator [Saccharothrix longispora]MDU0288381.1 TetR family transcriptional regulator [Saccharothrix longispora]